MQLATSLSISEISRAWNLLPYSSDKNRESWTLRPFMLSPQTWLKNLILYLLYQISFHKKFLDFTHTNPSFSHTIAYVVPLFGNALPLFSICKFLLISPDYNIFLCPLKCFNLKICGTDFLLVYICQLDIFVVSYFNPFLPFIQVWHL